MATNPVIVSLRKQIEVDQRLIGRYNAAITKLQQKIGEITQSGIHTAHDQFEVDYANDKIDMHARTIQIIYARIQTNERMVAKIEEQENEL